MGLEDHPGYLGWTSGGVILIHADWPAYALGHGQEYALERLGQYPFHTRFFAIDDIDQCLLLRVGDRHLSKDDFDPLLFHVALWHEDILKLFAKGLVEGAFGITPREWARRRCEELANLLWCDADGRTKPVPLPDPDDFDETQATVAVIRSTGMQLTKKGLDEFEGLMNARRSQITLAIAERVEPLLAIRAFDTAVREACLLLEVQLKNSTNTTLFGQTLVEKYFSHMQHSKPLIESHAKWLRNEVRACFSFVRNQFMHNFRDLTEPQCIALICRISATYEHVQDVICDNEA